MKVMAQPGVEQYYTRNVLDILVIVPAIGLIGSYSKITRQPVFHLGAVHWFHFYLLSRFLLP